MKIINKNTGNTLIICRRENTINFLGVPTKMKECGYTVIGDDDSIFNEHIVNCLDSEIIVKYINRYIKLLATKGLMENQEVIVDGKSAKILHWNDSNKYMPMYVIKTSKGHWSKQKRMLYGNCIVTGYKDFNHKL